MKLKGILVGLALFGITTTFTVSDSAAATRVLRVSGKQCSVSALKRVKSMSARVSLAKRCAKARKITSKSLTTLFFGRLPRIISPQDGAVYTMPVSSIPIEISLRPDNFFLKITCYVNGDALPRKARRIAPMRYRCDWEPAGVGKYALQLGVGFFGDSFIESAIPQLTDPVVVSITGPVEPTITPTATPTNTPTLTPTVTPPPQLTVLYDHLGGPAVGRAWEWEGQTAYGSWTSNNNLQCDVITAFIGNLNSSRILRRIEATFINGTPTLEQFFDLQNVPFRLKIWNASMPSGSFLNNACLPSLTELDLGSTTADVGSRTTPVGSVVLGGITYPVYHIGWNVNVSLPAGIELEASIQAVADGINNSVFSYISGASSPFMYKSARISTGDQTNEIIEHPLAARFWVE